MMTQEASAGTVQIFDAVPSSGTMDIQKSGRGRPRAQREAGVEEAVFHHIQAVRLLGNTRVNTAAIARSLGLPHGVVLRAVAKLEGQGVKAVHG